MLTIYSWGYWGWGNTAERLIRAVDATERARGFKPPVFWDIRMMRSVRARAFNGNSFEQLLPHGRYRWFPRLGNERITDGEGGIKIKDPSSARILLEEALTEAERDRRIIFFCACEFPRNCHRAKVAGLLMKEAERLGRKIEVVEWPGGRPVHSSIRVATDIFHAIRNGRLSVPLGERPKSSMLCLPWGSILDIKGAGSTLQIITGPANYQDGWCLPVWERCDGANIKTLFVNFRERNGLQPRLITGSTVHKPGAPQALTVRNPWAYAIVRLGKDVENRSWRTNYRGPVLIHASAKPEHDPRKLLSAFISSPPAKATLEDAPSGEIIGVADLFDCVDDSQSKWAQRGQWHWLLRNARSIKPVPCTGKLGLWTPSAAVLRKLPAWVWKR